ncbi:MAG: hypothetical protein IIA73_07125 [Proteobacteria bacterium]|nr:hypothetical protein [Pseudomonadota bacterium]
MLRLVLLLSGSLIAFPAMAQQAGPCDTRAEFLDHLSKTYEEAPVAMGVTSNGHVLEVVASESGTWTIIVTAPNGITCGIVAGENWETMKIALIDEPEA